MRGGIHASLGSDRQVRQEDAKGEVGMMSKKKERQIWDTTLALTRCCTRCKRTRASPRRRRCTRTPLETISLSKLPLSRSDYLTAVTRPLRAGFTCGCLASWQSKFHFKLDIPNTSIPLIPNAQVFHQRIPGNAASLFPPYLLRCASNKTRCFWRLPNNLNDCSIPLKPLILSNHPPFT